MYFTGKAIFFFFLIIFSGYVLEMSELKIFGSIIYAW